MIASAVPPQNDIFFGDEDAQSFASAFRYAASGMAIVSKGGRFLKVNSAFCSFLGLTEVELLKCDFQSLTHPDDLERDIALSNQLLEGVIESFHMEKRYLHKEGHWAWALLSVSLVRDLTGEPANFISQIQDITARKHTEVELMAAQQRLKDANHELSLANLELQKLAHFDGLTGLKNRRAFDEKLREEIARARRTKLGFSLVLLDIDHFKRINDSWGHATGDDVLCQIARLLSETLRLADTVARYGGEEFALILPNTGTLGSYRAAERCREAIAAYPWSNGPVTASCGIATWCDEDEQTLLVRADLVLYAAKAQGRNRTIHHQMQNES